MCQRWRGMKSGGLFSFDTFITLHIYFWAYGHLCSSDTGCLVQPRNGGCWSWSQPQNGCQVDLHSNSKDYCAVVAAFPKGVFFKILTANQMSSGHSESCWTENRIRPHYFSLNRFEGCQERNQQPPWHPWAPHCGFFCFYDGSSASKPWIWIRNLGNCHLNSFVIE